MSTSVRAPQVGPQSPTVELIRFASSLSWEELPNEVKHVAKRHLLDTIGVMVAGADGDIASRAEAMLAAVRRPGTVPVPGRTRRADILDASYLAGTAGHGIELDDGHRQGSVHPAVCIMPAALYAAYGRSVSGRDLLHAIVIGYEVMLAIAVSAHPQIRHRGFHPTSVTGVFGAAAAAGRILGLNNEQMANAFGIAASSGAGLFAFVNGGSDVKRLHAGHAAREGLQAALLAGRGASGPPDVIESKDGFYQAFAYGDAEQRGVTLPPQSEFRITDCYIKPYACCRHLQTAVETLIAIMDEAGLTEEDIRAIKVETYAISAKHAQTGWREFASAQLSFPYIMALGMRYRRIKIEHFEDDIRLRSDIATLCNRVQVEMAPDLDPLYPESRPSRVTVITERGTHVRTGYEALGCREMPISDNKLSDKFLEMTHAKLDQVRASAVLDQLWHLEDCEDVSPLLNLLVP